MRTTQTLIDECITKCGGQSELARRLDMKRQEIHAMAAGDRPISPATVGLLCDVLELDGEEARRLAVLAVIGNAKPEKRGVLRRAFFVSLALGAVFGAGAMLQSNEAGATGVSSNAIELASLYTLSILGALQMMLNRRRRARRPAAFLDHVGAGPLFVC